MPVDHSLAILRTIRQRIRQQQAVGQAPMIVIAPEALITGVARELSLDPAEVSACIERLVHRVIQRIVDRRGRWTLWLPRRRDRQPGPMPDLKPLMDAAFAVAPERHLPFLDDTAMANSDDPARGIDPR